MSDRLKQLLTEPVADITDFHKRLIKVVEHVLGPASVKPGFQYLPQFVEFENEHQFATGEAIAALARRARSTLTKKEKIRQKIAINRIICEITAKAKPEELGRRCFNVSTVTSLMLEEIGIWAVCYLGTLKINGKGQCRNACWYYVDDLIQPPQNSLARGHSWIFTPIFSVIDLTAKYQPIASFLSENTPLPVLVENELESPNIEESNYIDPADTEYLKKLKRVALTKENDYSSWNTIHKPSRYSGVVDLDYMPMSMSFAEKPMNELETEQTFGGNSVKEFFGKI